MVAALRDLRRLPPQLLEARLYRFAQQLDLSAGVVDVELADDIVAGPLEQRGDRVAECGSPPVGHVERTGRVRRHEFHVDASGRLCGASSVRLVLLEDAHQLVPYQPVCEAEVQESGPRDAHFAHTGLAHVQRLPDATGELPRRDAQPLRQHEGRVRGVVPVARIARSLQAWLEVVRGAGGTRGLAELAEQILRLGRRPHAHASFFFFELSSELDPLSPFSVSFAPAAPFSAGAPAAPFSAGGGLLR